jgi:hypothetical protein
MRRAHRHSELALSEQCPPAGSRPIRVFDYFSAGRRELETKSQAGRLQHDESLAANRAARRSRRKRPHDVVEEAGIESFPASDAPSFWGR